MSAWSMDVFSLRDSVVDEYKIRQAKKGHTCLVVDGVDDTVGIGVTTDTARDGGGHVLAYRPFTRKSDRRLSKRLKARLQALGLQPTKKTFRTQWLSVDTAAAVIELLYGVSIRRRFESEDVRSRTRTR